MSRVIGSQLYSLNVFISCRDERNVRTIDWFCWFRGCYILKWDSFANGLLRTQAGSHQSIHRTRIVCQLEMIKKNRHTHENNRIETVSLTQWEDGCCFTKREDGQSDRDVSIGEQQRIQRFFCPETGRGTAQSRRSWWCKVGTKKIRFRFFSNKKKGYRCWNHSGWGRHPKSEGLDGDR